MSECKINSTQVFNMRHIQKLLFLKNDLSYKDDDDDGLLLYMRVKHLLLFIAIKFRFLCVFSLFLTQ